MSKTILVVDDSKVDLDIVTNILESKSYSVLKATNGQAVLKTRPYRCVLG